MNADQDQAINVNRGEMFSVTLQSMIGSTNYGWCMTSMPKGVYLFAQCNEPTSGGIGPVNQVFHFLAITPANGKMEIEFKLLCLSDPDKVEKELSIGVIITEMDRAGGLGDFVRYSENSAVYEGCSKKWSPSMVLAYAAPYAQGYGACSNDDCCTVKYGYPPMEKYGYPPVEFKYGYPPIVKYGYPNCE
jgi:hypothetical protein